MDRVSAHLCVCVCGKCEGFYVPDLAVPKLWLWPGRVTGDWTRRGKKRNFFPLRGSQDRFFFILFLTGDSEQDEAVVSREHWRVAFHEMDSGNVYVKVQKFQSNISEIHF